jgi:hypothetical protein
MGFPARIVAFQHVPASRLDIRCMPADTIVTGIGFRILHFACSRLTILYIYAHCISVSLAQRLSCDSSSYVTYNPEALSHLSQLVLDANILVASKRASFYKSQH